MSSVEITAIGTEVARLEVLCDNALAVGNYHSYVHFRDRLEDLALVKLALVELDDRISALEP